MIDNPKIMLRIHIEVAELYEIGMIFSDQIAEGIKLDWVIGAAWQYKIVQRDMAAIALHGSYGAAGIPQAKTLGPVIGVVFVGLGAV